MGQLFLFGMSTIKDEDNTLTSVNLDCWTRDLRSVGRLSMVMGYGLYVLVL